MFSCCKRTTPAINPNQTTTLTIRYHLPFIIDEEAGGPVCPPHLFEPYIAKVSTLTKNAPSLRVLALPSSDTLAGLTLGHSSIPQDPGRSIQDVEIINAAETLGSPSSLSLSFEIIKLLLREGFIRIDSGDLNLVASSFHKANDFFALPLEVKKSKARTVNVVKSETEMVQRHVGFRQEGFREFFALRRQDNSEDIPSEWIRLFSFQETLSEKLFVLIAQGLGLSKSSVDHLFDKHDTCANSSVMRMYRYLRPSSSKPPGLFGASTGAHTDAGLLTVSPASNSPGLVVLSPDGSRWISVEGETLPKNAQRYYAFLGEQGSRFLKDATSTNTVIKFVLRPPVHFVDEREFGEPRFSAPFFLRAPLYSNLAKDSSLTAEAFLGSLYLRPWALVRTTKQVIAEEYASDF
jgi:isopenicillin N synthase-like dioxygenase